MERLVSNEDNKAIVGKAVATLVFPEIVKGGLIVGGEYGEGVLRKADVVAGYYRLIAASLGLQSAAGDLPSLAMLFMTEAALRYLTATTTDGGWAARPTWWWPTRSSRATGTRPVRGAT